MSRRASHKLTKPTKQVADSSPALKEYRRKRKFDQTTEPQGRATSGRSGPLRFVIQLHQARRTHYDFRLEFGGTYKSWAVPKGPSLNPQDQRLAVFVEDHPIEYGSFEGVIPPGNYGAGTVMIWDTGTYLERGTQGSRDEHEAAMLRNFHSGHLTFVLKGEKLNGEFALIRLKGEGKAWLLVKKRDQYSTYRRDQKLNKTSVLTQRTLDEISAHSLNEGKVWIPKTKKLKAAVKAKTATAAKTNLKVGVAVKTVLPSERIPKKMIVPRKIKPMIAIVGRETPTGEQWIREPAIGGVRSICEVERGKVRLYSRSGLSLNHRYPEIVEELSQISSIVVLDGEIVKGDPLSTLYVYDILYAQNQDLRNESLRRRLEILEKLTFELRGKCVRRKFPTQMADGWMSRNLESTYRSGPSSEWVVTTKVKTSSKVSTSVDIQDVRLTNLDKVFWPITKVTKGDLIEYYKSVSRYLLPYLIDRPESLNRHPNGIEAPGFYQKDMIGHFPRWLKTHRIFSESNSKTIDYVLCQDLRSLLYLVNLGCIEINPWFSRVQNLNHPDLMVIDLDPDGNSFAFVVQIALEICQILKMVGAKSCVKTSGATGLHIGVPTGARYDFDEVRDFAESVCQIVAKKYPSTTSIDRNPNRRRGKVYLDFMQNRRGQTLAAPYCVRPLPGCPVSMPLEWSEIRKMKNSISPGQFHMGNAIQRIQKFGDPWKLVLGPPINLNRCNASLKKFL